MERDVNILAAGTGIVPAFLRAKSAKCFLLCSPPQRAVFRHYAAGGTDDVCRIGAVKSLPPPCGGGAGKAPQRIFTPAGLFAELERDVNTLAAGTGIVPAFLRAKSAKCFLLCSPPQRAVFRHYAAGGTDDVCRIGAVKSLPPPCGGGAGKAPQRIFTPAGLFAELERDVNIFEAGTGIVPAFLRAKSAKDLYFYRLVLYNKMIKYNKNIG